MGDAYGVRPTKLVMQKLEAGLDQVQIRKFLEEEYCVTERKGRTCIMRLRAGKRKFWKAECQRKDSAFMLAFLSVRVSVPTVLSVLLRSASGKIR